MGYILMICSLLFQSIDIVGLELVLIHISLFVYRMTTNSYCLHYFRGMRQIKSQHECE